MRLRHRVLRKVFVLPLWALASSLGPLAAQTATPTPAPGGPPPPATALVIGRVIDAGSTEGLGGAVVQLTPGESAMPAARRGEIAPPGIPTRQRVIADASGGFVFHGLYPATYTITTSRPGYRDSAFGRLRPDGASSTLRVAVGERLTGIKVKMWKEATLAGTVVDDAGEPVVGIQVRAFQRTFAAGRPRFDVVSLATSDDRGAYRLEHLSPGAYIAAVTSTLTSVPLAIGADFLRDNTLVPELRGTTLGLSLKPAGDRDVLSIDDVLVGGMERLIALPLAARDGRLQVFPTTFHPQAVSMTQATVLNVSAGTTRMGVDITVRPVPAVKVRGRVVGPMGPVATATLRLVPAHVEDVTVDSSLDTAIVVTDAQGRFSIVGVPPGSYVLRGSKRPPEPVAPPVKPDAPAPMPTPAGPAVPTTWIAEPVTVGTDDLDLTIAANTGVRVSGHYVFEGATPAPVADRLQRSVVTIETADSRSYTPPSLKGDAGGGFESIGVPTGRYFVKPAGFMGWFLKSVTWQGREITDRPIDITSDLADLVVTFVDKQSDVGGAVSTAGGSAMDAAVLLFPAAPAAWTSFGVPSSLRSARPSATGAFMFTGITPGDYFLVAIPEETNRNWEPVFLETASRVATRVHVTVGDKLTVNLAVTVIK